MTDSPKGALELLTGTTLAEEKTRAETRKLLAEAETLHRTARPRWPWHSSAAIFFGAAAIAGSHFYGIWVQQKREATAASDARAKAGADAKVAAEAAPKDPKADAARQENEDRTARDAASHLDWNAKLSEHLVRTGGALFANDAKTRDAARDVIAVSFPTEVTEPLFMKLEAMAADEAKAPWTKGLDQVRTLAVVERKTTKPRVFVQFDEVKDADAVKTFSDTLRQVGFRAAEHERIKIRIPSAEVRYCDDLDQPSASLLVVLATDHYKNKNAPRDVKLVKLPPESRCKRGVIDVMLAGI